MGLPVVAAMMSPFVKDLFANGLSLLGNAIMSKGKAAVEEKLGVKLPDEAEPLTPEQLKEMRQLQFDHEENLLALSVEKAKVQVEGERVAQAAVTERWKDDILSDSWLSKNIRPLSFAHTLIVLDLLLICATSGLALPDGYLALVKELLMLMAGAYFVGRSVEKSIDLYQGWKQTKSE